MKQEKEQLTYTVVIHSIRKKLKLSLIEYCLADSIYHLSNNPKSKIVGWCWASKTSLSKILGVSEPTVYGNINKLEHKDIIERDQNTHYLRTTNKWYENVVLIKANAEYKETLYPIKRETCEQLKKDTQEYKDSEYNNNKDNNIYKQIVSELKRWNDNQSSPIRDFTPENIVRKHGAEKIKRLIKEFGKRDGGFWLFIKSLKQ